MQDIQGTAVVEAEKIDPSRLDTMISLWMRVTGYSRGFVATEIGRELRLCNIETTLRYSAYRYTLIVPENRMREINNFSLERHTGEYKTRPLRSRLIHKGVMLKLSLPGYRLLKQYDAGDCYLFITDYDCMFEEKIEFILVDKSLKRILSKRGIGQMYSSFLLNGVSWQDERHFTAIVSDLPFKFTIRRFFIPYINPKLGITYPHQKNRSYV